MLYVLLAVTLCAVAIALFALKKVNNLSRNNTHLKAIVNHQDGYTLLVNRDFEVETGNIPNLDKIAKEEVNLLGNVLHCKNAHDNGHCGESLACGSCPVRFVIAKSFEKGKDFVGLEASMEIYDKDNQVIDVDVEVGGHYIKLEQQGYMIVNVKNLSGMKEDERPKLLFISKDPSLFDRVRKILEADYRVLFVDNEAQALYRLKMITAYRFVAVFADKAFYGDHEDILKMLAKNDRVPLYVFANNNDTDIAEGIHFVDPAIRQESLLSMMQSQA